MHNNAVELERELNELQALSNKGVEDLQLQLQDERKMNQILKEDINSEEMTIGKTCNEKGNLHWHVHSAKIILQLLGNGSSPSAVAYIAATHAQSLVHNVIINELPCESYVRMC